MSKVKSNNGNGWTAIQYGIGAAALVGAIGMGTPAARQGFKWLRGSSPGTWLSGQVANAKIPVPGFSMNSTSRSGLTLGSRAMPGREAISGWMGRHPKWTAAGMGLGAGMGSLAAAGGAYRMGSAAWGLFRDDPSDYYNSYNWG